MKPQSSSAQIDPSLGETQKYKMECAGPGYSEKEQELHKSLIRDEEEELDSEVGGALTNGEFLQLIREENELYLPFVD